MCKTTDLQKARLIVQQNRRRSRLARRKARDAGVKIDPFKITDYLKPAPKKL